MISRRTFLRGAAGTLAGTGAFAGYSIGIEPRYRLVVTEWPLELPAWPESAPPLRIAALADIHACEPWMSASRIADIVACTNELRPDLIVLLGDYMDALGDTYRSRALSVQEWVKPLASLRAPLGVYAILGNHDWWYDAKAVRQGLTGAGIPVLENRAVKISRNGHDFWLAGLGDQLAQRKNGTWQGVDDLDGTLAQVTDAAPAILLAHEPDIIARVPRRVALTLSGHTHGGQVYVPFLGAPWIDTSPLGKQHPYGHLIEKGRNLIISGGLGLTARPIRFMMPPEITLVSIHSWEV
jgi:uncharacterized protein